MSVIIIYSVKGPIIFFGNNISKENLEKYKINPEEYFLVSNKKHKIFQHSIIEFNISETDVIKIFTLNPMNLFNRNLELINVKENDLSISLLEYIENNTTVE